MNSILSEHARKRCLRRKIDPAWIAQALAQPVRIERDAEDPELAHALWPVPIMGLRVPRGIYRETVDPVVVITACFDSSMNLP